MREPRHSDKLAAALLCLSEADVKGELLGPQTSEAIRIILLLIDNLIDACGSHHSRLRYSLHGMQARTGRATVVYIKCYEYDSIIDYLPLLFT